MQKTFPLKSQARTDRNTRRARAHRAEGRIPAVLYGGATPNTVHLTVDEEEFDLLLKKGGLLIDMSVDGKKEVCRVKELQRDALAEFVMHVDFERVDLTKPIEVDVPLVYKGTAKGIAQGGFLRIEAYKLRLRSLPLEVPDDIVVKIDDLELNHVLRLKDIQLPKGVTPLEDAERALCAIRPPVEEKEPEPAVAGVEGVPAEPEVIGLQSKKEEEEGEGAEGAAPAEKEKKEKKSKE